MAFVDHAAEITRKLRDALRSISDPESLAATSNATGLDFRYHTPRVFVIASISGGTGSGMVFDMGHTVRRTLEHLGLPAGCLCGMLTHSTSRAPERKTLAIADAYAWLREWKYWLGSKDGQGAACSPPAGEGHTPPLPQAYLLHLGDEVSEQDFDRAADDVAAYLCLDAATAGGEFFDKCRQSAAVHGPQGHGTQLRTFGVCQAAFSHDAAITRPADMIRQQLLDRHGCDNSEDSRPQAAGWGRRHDPIEHRLSTVPPLHAVKHLLSLDPHNEHDEASISACLDQLAPRLLACGGARRMLVAIPRKSITPQVRQYLAEHLGAAPRSSLTLRTRSSSAARRSNSMRIGWRPCLSANAATAPGWRCVSTRASTLPGRDATRAVEHGLDRSVRADLHHDAAGDAPVKNVIDALR